MKRTLVLVGLVAVLASMATAADDGCTRIKDGVLEYSTGHYLEGQPLKVGYDPYGYNYQAHMFNGTYANTYLGRDGFPAYENDDDAYLLEHPAAALKWYWPYRNDMLSMKWNDAWLSNEDCDGDGLLDRHLGYDAYLDSGAWLTNHQSGTDPDTGEHWTYFVKIIAAKSSWTVVDGLWFDENGDEVGPRIWNEFAVVEEIQSGEGVLYRSPVGPGLGDLAD